MTQWKRAPLLALLGLTPGLALSQTEGQLAKFDALGGLVDSSVTEDAAGNIGVGKTSPAAKLDIAGGNLNLENSTAATGNILKEGAPFIHNFGPANTFVGSNAGNLQMTGNGNTGNGVSALQSNTTGNGNSAFGAFALQNNTNGFQNTAIGGATLVRNTRGNFNTAIGSNALQSNTTGSANTASGDGALLLNTEGSSNSAHGFGALGSNTTGSLNAACGARALENNSDGSGNAAHGASALRLNTAGSDNTASGSGALGANSSGNNNTAAGTGALSGNDTGSDNTGVGRLALHFNSAGSFNTAIGSGANTPFGSELTNATAIGAGAIVDASNKIRLGNTAVEVIEGEVPYTFSSDKNRKENFRPLDGEEVLTKLRGLNVTSWNYVGQDVRQRRHYGAMAQDFFAAFGDDGVGAVGTATSINSGDMAGVTLAAAQALERRTVKQENRIDKQERRNADQDEQIAALRAENFELKARLEALERSARR